MRSFLARFIGLGLLVVCAASCQRNLVYLSTPTSAAATAAAERTAIIQGLSGTVETRTSENAAWTPAAVDQVLAEGTQLRTSAGGQATIGLTEGSHIYLGGATELTLSQLNPFLDSQLTTLDLKQGQVWVALVAGALDIKTPYGIASARNAYLSADLKPPSQSLDVTCLQGVCGFGSILIPSGYKLADAADNQAPEPLSIADYGVWGLAVPEATQLAYLSTEAVAQGSATLPVVATFTPSPTRPATATPTRTALPSATETAQPTETLEPNTPAPTDEPPTATLEPSPTPVPTQTPFPSPTQPIFQATVTPLPFTPVPAAPIIGYHTVQPGETVFCIARAYGVLPGAIDQANNLPSPFNITSSQVLAIPQVQWFDIAPGPVCPTQFISPFPGLVLPTATTAPSATPSGPPPTLTLDVNCIDNCGSSQGSYSVRIVLLVSGGIAPYTYNPAQTYDVTIAHCTDGAGNASVTSADNQTTVASWTFHDVSCP